MLFEIPESPSSLSVPDPVDDDYGSPTWKRFGWGKKSFFGAKRLYGIIKKSHVVSDVWVPAGTGPLWWLGYK